MNVQLPDGSTKEVPGGATVADLAASIGPRLAKDAIAGKINGKPVDLYAPIPEGAQVEVVTPRTETGRYNLGFWRNRACLCASNWSRVFAEVFASDRAVNARTRPNNTSSLGATSYWPVSLKCDAILFGDETVAGEISKRTAEFWDRRAGVKQAVTYWTEYPIVRSYVNECMTGVWWAYPTHGFKAAWAYRPLAHGLSIGCGTGNLERDLRWLRICEEVDAYDLSPESIRIARQRTEKDNIDHVNFEVADCEKMLYPDDHYDAVFFHGSLHHIKDPDQLLDRLLPSLRRGGFIYVDDYVGPSRDEWTQDHLQFAEEAYAKLPDKWRRLPNVAIPYDSDDPSEMIRSSRIIAAVKRRFNILYERPYWGNVLYPVLCHVDDEEAKKVESERILQTLIEYEKELTKTGKVTNPLFAWIVGQKVTT